MNQAMKPPPDNTEDQPELWVLIRDVAVLQFKLIVDGLRDLVLVPASLIAGLISVVKTKNGVPGSEFYQLVGVGKQSERWINLFGALENAPPEVARPAEFSSTDIDDIVSKVEAFVVDEYKRGGVTAQARDSVQQAMQKMRRRRPKPPP
jgi:hypothetical protein